MVITTIKAAMFAAIPSGKTKFSRNGYSIVFTNTVCGRHDLSERHEDFALAQAREAGLDLDAVTPEQVAAYLAWHDRMYRARQIDQARIRVTRIYAAEHGHELVPVNRVDLLDGWGNTVAWQTVNAEEYYDRETINRIGGKGAFCHRPDAAGIGRVIAWLRERHPEFSGARVQDNNPSVGDEQQT
ncbi:hypothetical protein [Azotobacter vinelandii]